MAKTGKFYHASTVTDDVASVGTAFNVAKYHAHPMYADSTETITTNGRFKGRIETIIVRVKSMSTTPITLTLKGCCDAAGDYVWFPDTGGEIATGVTTSTTGSAVYSFNLPLKQFFDSDTLYLFFKTDTGTVTIDASCIVWSE